MTNDNTFALQFNKDICTQCGICADSCTFGAIQFNEYQQLPFMWNLRTSLSRNSPDNERST